jgi:hypothetical protein
MSVFATPKYLTSDHLISPTSGKATKLLLDQFITRPREPPSALHSPGSSEPTDDALASVRFQAMILISKLTMHIDPAWRLALFRQLDQIIDVPSWDDDEPLPSMQSMETLMRAIIFFPFKKGPGLGLFNGLFLASWTNADASLTIECRPNDRIRWVFSHLQDGDREAASGSTSLRRLDTVLSPYDVEAWLFKTRR